MKHTKLSVLIPFAAFQILAVSGFAQDVRSYDGSGNNLANPSLGQTGSQLSRSSAGAVYADGLGAIIDRGNPRAISNLVSVQTAPENTNTRNLSSMFWQWGQFIDHDFALVDEGTESAGFAIPRWDSTFDPTGTGSASMPFNRSQYTGGVTTPRQQSNALTHWMDASMVYGSDAARANELRTHFGGLLKCSPGDMLPYNTNGIPNGGGTGSNMYMGGDVRVNEQSGLIAMHTVFMREHNRQAGLIAAANPTLSDEQIYQRARAIVAGEIQYDHVQRVAPHAAWRESAQRIFRISARS